jgi:hypothetical protein
VLHSGRLLPYSQTTNEPLSWTKNSSLIGQFVSYDEKSFFVNTVPVLLLKIFQKITIIVSYEYQMFMKLTTVDYLLRIYFL